MEVTIATTKRDLAMKRRELEECKRSLDYSVVKEAKVTQEVADLEDGLAFAEKILKERF